MSGVVTHVYPAGPVEIDYTNWAGKRRKRRVTPITLFYGRTEYHPEPQWLITAYDAEKRAERTFAVQSIHSWAPVP